MFFHSPALEEMTFFQQHIELKTDLHLYFLSGDVSPNKNTTDRQQDAR